MAQDCPPDELQAPDDIATQTPRPSRYPAVAGAVAGLWSLVVGGALLALLVMLLWVLSPDGEGGVVGAWRGVGLIWLGAQQVPLSVGGRELSLLPLGAVLPALLILRRAGLWAARIVPGPSWGECLTIVFSGALLYGAGGCGLAWLTMTVGTYADPAMAGAVVGLVGLVGLSWGVGSQAGWIAQLQGIFGDAAWRVWRGGLAAFLGLFAMGGVLVTSALVVQFQDVAATLGSLRAGAAGGFGLTLLGVFALPTMFIWAMAILVGAPVSFGGAGSLGIEGGHLGSLPALPALAALPASIPSWVAWGMLVPVFLGVLAGRIRWNRDLPTLTGVLTSAVGLAAVVAVLTAAAFWLSGGSLGGQQLAHIGPALPVAVARATGLVTLGFLAEAAWQAVVLNWMLHRSQSRAATNDSGEATAVRDPAVLDPAVLDLTDTATSHSSQAPPR